MDKIYSLISSWVSYSMAFIVGISGALSLNEWGVIIGAIVGAATFFTNKFYKNREDKRLEERQYWEREKFELEYELLKKKARGNQSGDYK